MEPLYDQSGSVVEDKGPCLAGKPRLNAHSVKDSLLRRSISLTDLQLYEMKEVSDILRSCNAAGPMSIPRIKLTRIKKALSKNIPIKTKIDLLKFTKKLLKGVPYNSLKSSLEIINDISRIAAASIELAHYSQALALLPKQKLDEMHAGELIQLLRLQNNPESASNLGKMIGYSHHWYTITYELLKAINDRLKNPDTSHAEKSLLINIAHQIRECSPAQSLSVKERGLLSLIARTARKMDGEEFKEWGNILTKSLRIIPLKPKKDVIETAEDPSIHANLQATYAPIRIAILKGNISQSSIQDLRNFILDEFNKFKSLLSIDSHTSLNMYHQFFSTFSTFIVNDILNVDSMEKRACLINFWVEMGRHFTHQTLILNVFSAAFQHPSLSIGDDVLPIKVQRELDALCKQCQDLNSYNAQMKSILSGRENIGLAYALARDLRKLTSELFRNISASNFSRMKWVKAKDEAPHLMKAISLFNAINAFVIKDILSKESAIERANLIKFWIRTAQASHILYDFQTPSAIISSLHYNAVSRLKNSWRLLPEESQEQFNTLSKAYSPLGNFQNIRTQVRNLLENHRFVVPPLGPFLTSLAMIDEGNPLRIDDQLNPMRIEILGKIHEELGRLQKMGLEEDFYMSDIVTHLGSDQIDDDLFHQLSSKLESSPRQNP